MVGVLRRDDQSLVGASNATFSPNSSPGVQDTTTFSSTFTDASTVSWTLTIKNSSSTTVRTFTGTGNVSKIWDGKNSSNAVVPDGSYVAAESSTSSVTWARRR